MADNKTNGRGTMGKQHTSASHGAKPQGNGGANQESDMSEDSDSDNPRGSSSR